MKRVSAAVEWTDGKIYLFGGDEYVRLDPAAGRADMGYPKPIALNWQGLFDSDIDAAVLWNDGTAYFFKGDQYIRYDVAADKAAAGYPKKIASSWPGVFDRDIDAAVLWNNGKAYFFKGDQYIRYDVATDKADAGYPKKIADSWPGLFTANIDDGVNWGPGKVVFLRGEEFVTYDTAADRADSPKPIPSPWFGSTSEPQPSGEIPEPAPLSPLRQRALAELDKLIPARYPTPWPTRKDGLTTKGRVGNWAKNNFSSLRPNANPNYTNCVEFPAYLVLVLNGGKKKLDPGFPPNTTKGWTDADGTKTPLPGDIFILLNPGGKFGHVGVIYDTSWKNSQGLLWRTADWGQGDGWDGDWVERTYDPVEGTLTGGPNSPRKLLGWVDLDALFE